MTTNRDVPASPPATGKGYCDDPDCKGCRPAPVASGTPKEQERADAALWLSRSSLWLHIPQLANIPSGFGGTMFDAIAALRKEYPGDYPLDKFSPAPAAPGVDFEESMRVAVDAALAAMNQHSDGMARDATFKGTLNAQVRALVDAARQEEQARHQELRRIVAEWQEARKAVANLDQREVPLTGERFSAEQRCLDAEAALAAWRNK